MSGSSQGRGESWKGWLFEGMKETTMHQHAAAHHKRHPWWQVMCLTGVDYFSTLGYQPGIAFLAAGVLSPIATVILVLLTLLGALPIYRRVAAASPHGQGSISMLESLLVRWKGKVFVLVLLGFAMTDFVITITLSAADATAHIRENPFVEQNLHEVARHPVIVTFVLLLLLGAIFLKGFKEAIGLAVLLVVAYMGLNAIVLGRAALEIANDPALVSGWQQAILAGESKGSPLMMLLLATLVFPKLALGLSGFETGVAVMPLVDGGPIDSPINPEGRIRNTKKLLTAAALVMSVMLIGSSFATTLLVPAVSAQGAHAFEEGGEAYGRALAFLAHHYFGDAFGTLYDASTIAILWFAGASAMAALINLVPRYLPRYGMAPEWAKATRPLVIIFTLVTLAVTWIFEANVEAQGGAYATGVLVLMSSAAVAVTLLVWPSLKLRAVFGLITAVFLYTTLLNVYERPDGVKIAAFFIGAVIVTSLVSRAMRSTELRIRTVILDDAARRFIGEAATNGHIRIVANRPDTGDLQEYKRKEREARDSHHIPPDEKILILEVRPGDASEFTDEVLEVAGLTVGPYRVLRCESPAIPNAIAAVLMEVQSASAALPHVYFGWTEGNPIAYVLKFILFGEGDTAPVTREVLRRLIANPLERPRVHVG